MEEQLTQPESDPNTGGTAADIERLAQERAEYLDGWQRARADLINFRKDEAKRAEETVRSANEALVRDLVMVLDNFDLAIAAAERQGAVDRGVQLIRGQFEDILKQYGLSRMPVEPGQPFDPALHEAIATVESDAPSGAIAEEIEKGYYLHGKLIRPSRVKVAQ